MSEEGAITVAYLGPKGTYGHQAASELIARLPPPSPPSGHTPSTPSSLPAPHYTYIPCPTIPSIYTSSAEYLVMPLQNTIHGGVLETLDSLLSVLQVPPEGGARERPLIVDSVDLGIRHCLVVKRGTRMEDIRWVRSHEQALGQSTAFLSRHLPHAARQQWPSTAGAAASLLDTSAGVYPVPNTRNSSLEAVKEGEHANGRADQDESDRKAAAAAADKAPRAGAGAISDSAAKTAEDIGAGAAICSKAAIKEYPELEVLYEGTQGIENNFTRFLLLSRSARPSSPRYQRSSSPATSSLPTPAPAPGATHPAACPSSSPSLSHSSSFGQMNGSNGVKRRRTSKSPISHEADTSNGSPAHSRKETHFYALDSPVHLSTLAKLGEVITVHSRPVPAPISPPAHEQTVASASDPTTAGEEALRTTNRYPIALLVEVKLYADNSDEKGHGVASLDANGEGRDGQAEELGGEGIVWTGWAPVDGQ